MIEVVRAGRGECIPVSGVEYITDAYFPVEPTICIRISDIVSTNRNWAVSCVELGVQFSRGTNFTCFATAGNGSIVVGSKDGKVRLYGTTSMRMVSIVVNWLASVVVVVCYASSVASSYVLRVLRFRVSHRSPGSQLNT